MKKKLALLLAFSLVLSLIPATALMANDYYDEYDYEYEEYENGYEDEDAEEADENAEEADEDAEEAYEDAEEADEDVDEADEDAEEADEDTEDEDTEEVPETPELPVTPVVADVVALRFVIGETTFTRNGVAQVLDYAPFIENERTMVPFRALGEALGAQVGWDDETRYVSFGDELSFSVDASLYVDHEYMGSPVIREDRTFVPLRFVSVGLGFEVYWDDEARAVYITG